LFFNFPLEMSATLTTRIYSLAKREKLGNRNAIFGVVTFARMAISLKTHSFLTLCLKTFSLMTIANFKAKTFDVI
jgi:hypothetical protein